MSRARSVRLISLLALPLVAALNSGCTHYHYYGQAMPPQYVGQVPASSACDPVLGSVGTSTQGTPVRVVAAPSSTVVSSQGAICEVPATSDEYVVIGQSGEPKMLSSAPAGSRSRFAWRRPDPESMATTRIDGNISEYPVR